MSNIVNSLKHNKIMSGIKSKNTQPEILIRKELFARGYRFRLHSKDLPGKPDVILPKFKIAIFINGCFWHGHNCHLFKWPQTKTEFWKNKIHSNQKRDEINIKSLLNIGWRVLVIWECSLKGKTKLKHSYLFEQIELWILSNSNYVNILGDNEGNK